jgi:OOP family OmpA-OmpF porin
MKKIIIIALIGLILFSCKNEKKTEDKKHESTATQELEKSTSFDELYMKEFDWTKIPISTAEIGSFPYVTAPDDFLIWKSGQSEKSKNGMTTFSEYGKLICYNGKNFINFEGKKAELQFEMKEKSVDFNQFKFDKSIEEYLKTIGAVEIFKGKIIREKLVELNKENEKNVYEYIIGDSWNSDPLRHYVLNHKNGKIIIQVWSNSAEAKIGVLELEGFKQTIKAPTALDMQNEIEKTGKAVLNINFDTDKTTLKPDGQKMVDEILLLLNSNSKLKLSIEGHTDNTGSASRNKQLSSDRANTVMYALVGKGVNINRLKATGFGSEKPLKTNDTEQNKAQNRRVELVKF